MQSVKEKNNLAIRSAKIFKNGLSQEEARKRLRIFGYNEIAKRERFVVLKGLLAQFKNPLIILLLITAAASLFLKQGKSAIVIFIMVFLSVGLDFAQEFKAKKAAAKLKEKIKIRAQVMRGGKKIEIPAREIVPGDVVALSAGSIIPADCRILQADDFFVNEAALTGESFPSHKYASAAKDHGHNLVFLGTNAVSGSALALVLSTGKKTKFGDMAEKLAKPDMETDFEKGARDFGFFIMKITVFLVIFVFLANALWKRDILQSLLFSLALAVGLTPELLPMIVSFTMARGATAMAKHGVIVKKLNSIHNFGSMDVLCTDKTGTLTENTIKLIKHVDARGKKSHEVFFHAYINSFFQSGIANPLDDAVLQHDKMDVRAYKKLDEIPFDFSRKRISIIVKNGNKKLMVTKGAPEEIFKICRGAAGAAAQKIYNGLSADGFRVLALAGKQIKEDLKNYPSSLERGMRLLGFVAFLDPPKLAARESIELLEKQKIEVKILTGDNELVTGTICRELNVPVKGTLLGAQIDKLNDDALRIKAEEATIFARLSPEQKNRVILALKANGHSVGYLGDGINDALPLKNADVGISVDNASDVAKESADMILLNKSLRVLSQGVREGRRTFGNTMKYILMNVSSNFGNMFSVAGASFLLPFLPMLPVQILLNNFLYDFSQIAIPMDNVDEEYLQKPRRWNIHYINRFMWIFGPLSSLFDFVMYFVLFFVFSAGEGVFQTAWFLESLVTQTLVIFLIRTRKAFFKSRPGKYIFISAAFFLSIGLIIPLSGLGKYFGFAPLPPKIFLSILAVMAVYFSTVETVKHWAYGKALKF